MRGTLYFLRKPLKPIIYSVIFCVLTLVAFIFALQYELDKIAIDENVKNYSYVGTIIDINKNTPELSTLPSDLVKRISESEYIKEIDIREVVSGKTERTNAMLEYFITDDTIDMYGMIEGYIWAYYGYDPYTKTECAQIAVLKNWAGVLKGQNRIFVTIHRDDALGIPENESVFQSYRVLLTGRFYYDRANNGMKFTEMEMRNPKIKSSMNILDDNPVIPTPWDLQRAEADEYVTEQLRERGMLEYVDKINQCAHTFTIRPVKDMSLLLPFNSNATYICGGRGLTEEDLGKKVCVINQVIASKNTLFVGDKIKIAISDENFKCSVVTHDATWESGFPKVNDEFPEYGEYEEYEIVGIFNYYFRRDCEEDMFSYSRNDIFIPEAEDAELSYEDVTPADISFRIIGPEYEDFLDEFEEELYSNGYALRMHDAGWDDFQENYETITERKIISVISSCLFFTAAIVLLLVLILKHLKYEFGLRRLLGATIPEASALYLAGYLILALPALAVALCGTLLVYDKWLIFKMAEVIEAGLPDTVGCLALMGKWTGGAFVGGLVLLTVLAAVNGRKNLLGMIK